MFSTKSMVYACLTTVALLAALLPLQHSNAQEMKGYIVEYGSKLDVSRLRSQGFVDTAYAGYATIKTTPAAVEKLRELGLAVYRPRIFRPMLDLSTVDIGVDLVGNVTGVNAEALDGRGILIAVVDTGVDLDHPAFKTPEGRSRILYVWDQTLNGKPPKGFSYGYECGPEEVQRGGCPEKDLVGHGTIVASIAAGGVVGEWRLRGVAPGAELIVVKSGGPACGGSRWFFDEKGLIDGIAYAVEKARSIGRRLVVVLSLGTNLGGHDGGEPLEKMLEAWAEQGVIFAVAAGNSGDEARHATGFLYPGQKTSLAWRIPRETKQAGLVLTVPHTMEVKLRLVTPAEKTMEITFNKTVKTESLEVETTHEVREKISVVSLSLSHEADLYGVWGLEMEAVNTAGVWHGWVESDTCSDDSEVFLAGLGYSIEQSHTVTIPGTARNVLTVGAYATRTRWKAGGSEWGVGGNVGELESYSGRGPTVDNRTKPEITAPGGVIFGAGPGNLPKQAFSPSELVRVGRGTSMATPHAAGVAALILQLAPELTAHQVIELVKNNARRDEFTGPIAVGGSSKWGWGKLNADIAYVVELVFKGRAAEARPYIDFGGKTFDGSSGVIRLAALRGLHYNITPRIEGGNESTQYEIEPKTLVLTAPLDKALFSIEVKHRLRMLYENGSLLEELWVKEGGTVNLDTLMAGRGLEGYEVWYLLDDGTSINGVISVSGPTNVKLLLRPMQAKQPSIAVLVAASVAAFLSAALVIAALKFRHAIPYRDNRRQAPR